MPLRVIEASTAEAVEEYGHQLPRYVADGSASGNTALATLRTRATDTGVECLEAANLLYGKARPHTEARTACAEQSS